MHDLLQMRHIRRAQGKDCDIQSVHDAAALVFKASGLDLATGSINEVAS